MNAYTWEDGTRTVDSPVISLFTRFGLGLPMGSVELYNIKGKFYNHSMQSVFYVAHNLSLKRHEGK